MKTSSNHVLMQRKILLRLQLTMLIMFLFAVHLSASVIMDGQKVTVSKENVTLGDVLKKIEKNLQIRTITGTVTDDKGQALIGVTVVVKNTTTGTITDISGKFSLDVPADADILVFSYVGMQDQEVNVAGRTSVDIIMEVALIEMEEVVAIGYGTLKRKELTSSIATVNEAEFKQGGVYQSPLELIAGKVAGLAISRSDGGDPNGGVEMQLRGVSSIRASTSPLVVIDGVPGATLNSIAPENIASIDVMRDGSAAAIYGTRATNGVILITTKKGTPGKSEVKYSTYFYTEEWYNKPQLLTSGDWRHYKEEFENSDDSYLQSIGAAMIDYGSDTDWLEVVSRNPLSQMHNISPDLSTLVR